MTNTAPDPVAPLSAEECERIAATYDVDRMGFKADAWRMFASMLRRLSRLEREQGAAGGEPRGTWSPHPTIAGAMRYSGDYAGLPVENVDRALGSPELSRQERGVATTAVERGPAPRGEGPWLVRLSCCGRDDGAERFPTWDEADAFRRSYTSGPSARPYGSHGTGHERAGIISCTPPDDKAGPAPGYEDRSQPAPWHRVWMGNDPAGGFDSTDWWSTTHEMSAQPKWIGIRKPTREEAVAETWRHYDAVARTHAHAAQQPATPACAPGWQLATMFGSNRWAAWNRAERRWCPEDGSDFVTREEAAAATWAQQPATSGRGEARDLACALAAVEGARKALSSRGYCGDGNLAEMVARALGEAVERADDRLHEALDATADVVAKYRVNDFDDVGTLAERVERVILTQRATPPRTTALTVAADAVARLNVNGNVLVRLSEHGAKVLAASDYGDVADKHWRQPDGRHNFQLWHLMQLFGAAHRMGDEPCFEGNTIEIPLAQDCVALRAEAGKGGERCTCGSGAHPRHCAQHPEAFAAHVAELNRANDADNALVERAEAAEQALAALRAGIAGALHCAGGPMPDHELIEMVDRTRAGDRVARDMYCGAAVEFARLAGHSRDALTAERDTAQASLAAARAEVERLRTALLLAETIAAYHVGTSSPEGTDVYCNTCDDISRADDDGDKRRPVHIAACPFAALALDRSATKPAGEG